jgi:hypothetical protein
MTGRPDNTSRSALIRGGIFAVALCAAVLLVSTVALATDIWSWDTIKLYSIRYDSPNVVDQGSWIELTPSCRRVDDYFVYSYELTNTNALGLDGIGYEKITAFNLTFTDVLNRNIQFVDFRPMTGWGYPDVNGHYVDGIPADFQFGNGRELMWRAQAGGGLVHGESITFGFTTTLDPDSDQDNKTSGMGLARGYDGYTYGPGPQTNSSSASVPELPAVFLGLPGLAFVQVIRRRLAGRRRAR